MANPDHVELVRQGADAIATWRTAHPMRSLVQTEAGLWKTVLRLVVLDLTEADLRKADLHRADLSWADLRGANLQRADLRGANLERARLEGADLERADLSGASLIRANLQRGNLTRAKLSATSLIWAVLDGAIITNADLWETQRAFWSIRGIICEAIYWRSHRGEPTTYAPGEFERLYADNTKIVLRYEDGIHPIEIATLPALIQQMMAMHPGCVLRLRSIEEGPGGATVTLVADNRGDTDPTKMAAMKAELEDTGLRLIYAQRKALQEKRRREQVQYALDFAEKVLRGSRGETIRIAGRAVTVGDMNINAGQAGPIGRGAHDMTFHQQWNHTGPSIDLQTLATELATLRQHLRQAAVEPKHDAAIGRIAQSEIAAKEGDGPKVLEQLSKAGLWALNNAEKIGVGVATAALKTALGL